jgi:hypothetical protein
VSQSFGYIPKSGIAESNGRSMFSFLSSLQIFFQRGCTSLRSHQQCKRVPFPLHPRQHLLFVVSNNFLSRTPIAQKMRTRIDKRNCTELKHFCTAKETITRMMRQPIEWEKNLCQLFI